MAPPRRAPQWPGRERAAGFVPPFSHQGHRLLSDGYRALRRWGLQWRQVHGIRRCVSGRGDARIDICRVGDYDSRAAFSGRYGFNQLLFQGFHPSFLDTTLVRAGWIDLDDLSLRGREDIPVLLDARMPWSGPMIAAHQRPPLRPDSGGYGIMTFCVNRHETFVSGLFLDWSVRKVGLKEFWTLKWSDDFDRAGPWTNAGGATPEDWPKWMRPLKDY
jgi:hypothetical protein